MELGARFRISTQSGLNATGLVPNGEVEDYIVRVDLSVNGTFVDPLLSSVSDVDSVTEAVNTIIQPAPIISASVPNNIFLTTSQENIFEAMITGTEALVTMLPS
jgi:hypothetical protein